MVPSWWELLPPSQGARRAWYQPQPPPFRDAGQPLLVSWAPCLRLCLCPPTAETSVRRPPPEGSPPYCRPQLDPAPGGSSAVAQARFLWFTLPRPPIHHRGAATPVPLCSVPFCGGLWVQPSPVQLCPGRPKVLGM